MKWWRKSESAVITLTSDSVHIFLSLVIFLHIHTYSPVVHTVLYHLYLIALKVSDCIIFLKDECFQFNDTISPPPAPSRVPLSAVPTPFSIVQARDHRFLHHSLFHNSYHQQILVPLPQKQTNKHNLQTSHPSTANSSAKQLLFPFF